MVNVGKYTIHGCYGNGRLEDYSPIGKVTFQGRAVKLREGTLMIDFYGMQVGFGFPIYQVYGESGLDVQS